MLRKAEPSRRTLRAAGQVISDLRLKRGLTIENLARRARCSSKTIENLENGKSAYMATFVRVARALDIHVQKIMLEMKPQFVHLPEQQHTPTNTTLSITVPTDSPEDFLYLSYLLNDAARKYAKFKAVSPDTPKEIASFLFPDVYSSEPHAFHFILLIPSGLATEVMAFVIANNRLPDFAVVLEERHGPPSIQEIMQLEHRYGIR
jgi:transcriptional regulator with XRE-family HTH domain